METQALVESFQNPNGDHVLSVYSSTAESDHKHGDASMMLRITDLTAESADDHPNGLLHVEAPLLHVEQLVLSNLRGTRLMLHLPNIQLGDALIR